MAKQKRLTSLEKTEARFKRQLKPIDEISLLSRRRNEVKKLVKDFVDDLMDNWNHMPDEVGSTLKKFGVLVTKFNGGGKYAMILKFNYDKVGGPFTIIWPHKS